MATVAEQLVGRAEEIGVIENAVSRLKLGGPDAIAVIGEPGIGKTRLLSELAGRGDESGCIVLSGSGSEFEQDLPFWVFVDALDEYVAGLDPRRLESLDEGVRGDLAGLFPSLSEYAGASTGAPQDQRYRAHRAVGELVQRLAATKPLVLVLDDVHWADSASIDLLGALLRRPPAASVLLAIGARPRQMPERLASALERADRAGTLTRLELGALGRDEAGQLLGEGANAALADELYRQSGGNPFYLEELARSLERGGAAPVTGTDLSLTGVVVPRAVAAALTEELGLLAESSRRLFEGAAVAGDPFEPELAAPRRLRSTTRPRFRRSTTSSRATSSGARTSPGAFASATRWYERLSTRRRPAGGCWARTSAAPTRSPSVAPRRRRARTTSSTPPRPGDMDAVELLRQAGGTVMVSAPASAARWFEAALRVLPDDAAPQERLGLLMARAASLASTGQLEQSRATLLETLALVPGDAVEMWVQLTVACAGVEHFLGRHDWPRSGSPRRSTACPDQATPEAVALMLELAVDGLFRTDYDSCAHVGRARARCRSAAWRHAADRDRGAVVVLRSRACIGDVAEAEGCDARPLSCWTECPTRSWPRRPDAAGYLAAAEL